MAAWTDEETSNQGTTEPVVEDPIVTVEPDVQEKEDYYDEYDDNVNNTSVVPIADLLVHASGYSWTISEYYNQFLGSDQSPSGFDINISPLVQQYTLIRKLEIKVETPLTPVNNPDDNTWQVEGSGVIYAGLKPIKGDVFKADIGDGRIALLQLTESRPLSILKQACYGVSYKVINYVTKEIDDNLTEKVIRTFTYHRERLANATSGLLSSESSAWLKMLQRSFSLMFMDEQEKTIALPDDTSKIYDEEITAMAIDIGLLPDINKPVVYTGEKKISIIDFALGQTVFNNLIAVGKELREARELRTSPVFGGLGFTSFTRFVNTVNIELPEPTADIPEIPEFSTVTHEQPTYITSGNFYRNLINNENLQVASKLEQQLQAFIRKEAMDTPLLLELSKKVSTVDPLSAFYQIPLLFLMLKVALDEL